jgi:hypothetical protein
MLNFLINPAIEQFLRVNQGLKIQIFRLHSPRKERWFDGLHKRLPARESLISSAGSLVGWFRYDPDFQDEKAIGDSAKD